jgi:uncharacterized protein
MIVIGFGHCVLLYVGDIIAAYGLLGLLLTAAVRWRDRVLLGLAALVFVVLSVPGGADPELTAGPDPTMLPADPVAAFAARAAVFPLIVPLEALGLLVPFLLGIVAARRRLLEEPGRHRALLGWTAGLGTAAAVVGGLPMGLTVAGVLPAGADLGLLTTLHAVAGYLGGPGYAAVIALLAARTGKRRGPVTRAVAAVGQRSMTCYLAQSVVWTLVFAPYVLDLSDELGVTSTAALALGTWLLTVATAELMRRRGSRGPAEVALRRLSYRTRRPVSAHE